MSNHQHHPKGGWSRGCVCSCTVFPCLPATAGKGFPNMARIEQPILVCDVDERPAVTTRRLLLDGRWGEIDLCADCEGRLAGILAGYIPRARKRRQ